MGVGLYCPNCGSDKVEKDQCTKCGTVISQYRPPDAGSSNPSEQISFIPRATLPGPAKPVPSPQAPVAARPSAYKAAPAPPPIHVTGSFQRKTEKQKLQRSLIMSLVGILMIAGVYELYSFVKYKVSSYSGYYRNVNQHFSMFLPEEGWCHYYSSDLKDSDFQDASDAFFRGSSPKDPDVLMAIWVEYVRDEVPESFDPDTTQRMLSSLQNIITERMAKKNLDCSIISSSKTQLGGNDGLKIEANVTRGTRKMKTTIYCGFNLHYAYTIQFLATEDAFIKYGRDIDYIIGRFSYRTSLI